jgi:hypothetical protein
LGRVENTVVGDDAEDRTDPFFSLERPFLVLPTEWDAPDLVESRAATARNALF